MQTYYSSFFTEPENVIGLPPMNNLNTLQITFWAMYYSTAPSEFQVGYIRNGSFTSLQAITLTSSFDEYTLVLSGAPANAEMIAFRSYYNGSSASYVYIDDITVEVPPTCIKPSNLTVSNITASSAKLAWDAGGTEINWQYLCANHGFTPDWSGANVITSNTHSNVPSNINYGTGNAVLPNTEYDFYVRANCGGGDYSEPIMITFRTECEAVSIPYSQNFDSETDYAIPDCWKNIATYYTGTYTYPGVYNSSTYAHSTSKSLRMYTYTSATQNIVALPPMDDINTLQISFWARYYSTNPTEFQLGYIENGEFHQVGSNYTLTTTYQHFEEISLAGVPATAERIAFRSYREGASYAHIDDIEVDYLPSCPKPTSLTFVSSTTTTATISWTKGGSESSWQYTLDDGASWNNFASTSTVNTTITGEITGLSASSTYNVKVRAYCSAEDQSDASNAVTVVTQCGATSLPYSENFDGISTGTIPNCWTKLGNGTANVQAWKPNSGANSLKFTSASGNNIIVLPSFSREISTLQLSFTTRPESITNSSCGTFSVGYVTDIDNASSFVAVQTYSYDEWTEDSHKSMDVVMSDAPAGSYFAFKHDATSTAWYWGVDDVYVDVLPSCFPPIDLTVSSITANSATVTWNPSGHNEGSYDYVVVQSGQEPNWNDAISNTSRNLSLSGLSGNTDYDVYVRSNCGSGDYSSVVKVSFKTLCGIISSYPWNENFDRLPTSQTPACWTKLGNGSAQVVASYPNSSPNSLRFSGATSDNIIVFPQFSENISNLKLSFYTKPEGTSSSGDFYVGYVTDPNDASTFVSVDTYNCRVGTTYDQKEYVMSGAQAGSYFAFKHNSGATNWYWFVDDITVKMQCLTPTGLAVDNITGTSARLSWTPAGDESEWEICLNGDENNLIVAGSNPYTLTGLSPTTSYTVKVRASCGDGDYSDWTTVSNFTTIENECEISYELVDSYGDGWNGNAIEVYDANTDDLLATWTIDDGASASGTISLVNGREIKFVWVDGRYIDETSYVVYDASGNVLLSDSGEGFDDYEYTMECPSCQKPTDLAVSNITSTGATLAWDGASSSYVVMVNGAVLTANFETNDLSQADFTSTADYPFTVVDLNGNYVAKSNNEGNNNTTADMVLQIRLNDASTIYFRAKVSSEEGWDKAYFSIDGSVQSGLNGISGDGDWVDYSFDVSSGTHTFRWYYEKDGSSYNGDDCFYVDDIAICYSSTWTEVDVAGSPYNIRDLSPERMYVAKVKGVCADEESVASSVVSFSTLVSPCDRPTNLAASNITATTADIAWTANNGETAWVLKYGPAGFYVESEGTAVNVSTTPAATLTELIAGGIYDVYVKANCGGGNYSAWVNVTFQTPSPCSDATAMECGQTYSGTLGTSSAWDSYPSSDCDYEDNGAEKVYSFVPQRSGNYWFSGTSTDGDANFRLFDECDMGVANLVICWDDDDVDAESVRTANLTSGITYYLIVDNHSSSADADFEVSVTCPTLCDLVTVMTCGETYSGTLGTVGEWDSYDGDPYNWSEPGEEKVYSFAPSVTGIYSFSGHWTNGNGDPDFFLMSSCGNSGCITSWSDETDFEQELTAGTTYYLIVDNYSDSDNASYEVSVSLSSISISASAPNVCKGYSVDLEAPEGGSSYSWNTEATVASISPTINADATYRVTVWSGSGCSASGSVDVEMVDKPSVSFTQPAAVCSGAVLSLSASVTDNGGLSTTDGYTISEDQSSWSTFTTTAPVTDDKDNYYIKYTASNDCGDSEIIRQITVHSLPTASIDGTNPLPVCVYTQVTLNASGAGDGGSYAWDNELGSGASKTITVTEAKNYTVIVTDANTCTARATKSVTIKIPGNLPSTYSPEPGIIWTGYESTDWDDQRNWLFFNGDNYTPIVEDLDSTLSVVLRTGGTEQCILHDPVINNPEFDANAGMTVRRNITVANGTELNIGGALTLEGGTLTLGGSTYLAVGDTVLIANGASVSFSASDTLVVNGNFTLSGNINFVDQGMTDNEEAVDDPTDALVIGGDLTINGARTFSPAGGSIVFARNSGNRRVYNNTGRPLEFFKVELDDERTRSGVPHTVFPDGTIIKYTAIFSYGIWDGDLIFAKTGNALVKGGFESYASGNITKIGKNKSFSFPTGGNDVLGSIAAKIPTDVQVSAKFNSKTGGYDQEHDGYPRWWNNNDMCDGSKDLDHVSNYEYWTVRANTTTTLTDLTFTAEAADRSSHFNPASSEDEAVNEEAIRLAMYNGCWKNLGGADNVIVDDGKIEIEIPALSLVASGAKGIADDPIITLGSTTKTTILPIELTSFTATCDGRSSLVEWSTASERNNDYFSLERSDDAINFTEIARVAGAGTTIEPLDYSYTDYGIHGGDNYYRLVQVDYDGTRTASEIVVANCVESAIDGEPEVMAYPNPFNGELTLVLDNFSNRAATIEVYDMLGKLFYTEKASAPQNSYETILNLSNLPSGAYTVRVSTTDFVINRNVVKQ
ncbi:MAG: fibronectin type III domain-containing protein [Bacteroidales bacterium]|nr:fibronectin type III domain-containing protein [Bacteroidales bacterium]